MTLIAVEDVARQHSHWVRGGGGYTLFIPNSIMECPNNFDKDPEAGQVLASLGWFLGAIVGAGLYGILQMPSFWKFVILGGLAGSIFSRYHHLVIRLLERVRKGQWRISEASISGVTFISNSSQRKAAWKIYFNLMTRVTTRPLNDLDGDNEIALDSLYQFFVQTRAVIQDLDNPVGMGTGELERFSLELLNKTLAPFLSKWHPKYDAYQKEKAGSQTTMWPLHSAFRSELRDLQQSLMTYSDGLAKIAEVTPLFVGETIERHK